MLFGRKQKRRTAKYCKTNEGRSQTLVKGSRAVVRPTPVLGNKCACESMRILFAM